MAARQATLKTEGPGIVCRSTLSAPPSERVTWDTLQESLNMGYNADATYVTTGKAPDTTLAPAARATAEALETERRQKLAQQCAAATATAAPGTEDEATHMADLMGAAGL